MEGWQTNSGITVYAGYVFGNLSVSRDDYYDAEDYIDADDFASDWEDSGDFEDYDDAYDYYEEVMGHD